MAATSVHERTLTATPVDPTAAPDLFGARPVTDRWWAFPAKVFVATWLVLMVIVALSVSHFAPNPVAVAMNPAKPGGIASGWSQWDGHWYESIARDGYSYTPGQQSPVAFFPAYPLAMRLLLPLLRDPTLAGMLLSALGGGASLVLLYRWCQLRAPELARPAVVALALYPYAWYLFGAIYADAFFLAATLAAFVAIETGHRGMAGLAGLVATAARPTGVALLAALLVLQLGWQRSWPGTSRRLDAPTGRGGPRAAWLAAAGLGGWCSYLWVVYGQPFLFATVQSAPGWDQPPGWQTFTKAEWCRQVLRLPLLTSEVRAGEHPATHNPRVDLVSGGGLLLQAALVLVVILVIPAVWRRFGGAYALYTAVVVALPVIGSKDFQGTGRYLLAAFPAFVIIAGALARRPRLAVVVGIVSSLLLVTGASLYARGFYLS